MRVQESLQTIENEINENNKNIQSIQQNIRGNETIKLKRRKNKLLYWKIKYMLEKELCKKRLVSMQHTDQVNIFLEVILNSKSLADLLERASAATTILNADKELLVQQQQDLQKIEEEKASMDQRSSY